MNRGDAISLEGNRLMAEVEDSIQVLGKSETKSSGMAGQIFGYGLKARWQQFYGLSPSGSNVLITVGTNIVLGGIGLITGPLAARLLGPSGRGELAAIQNLFWLIAIFALFGLPEATLYFTARYQRQAGKVLATGTLFSFLTAPVFFVVMYPLVPLLLAAQPPSLITAARWFLLGVPLYALMVVPMFAVRGTNHLIHWNLLRLLPGVGWLLFLIVAWVAAKHNPIFLAAGYLVVLACMFVPTAIIIPKLIQGPYFPSRKLLKPMLRYSLPLVGAAIPQTFNLRLDQLLIAAFLPPYLLGLYVVAVAWSGAAFPILHAIGNVLFPKIVRSSTSLPERATMISQAVRLGALAAGLLAAFLLACTPLAIPLLFGRAFAPAVPVGYILVLAAVICGMNVILEESLRGLGDTAGVLWGETTGLLVTVLSLVIMLRPLGIMGAGVASVLGYTATFGFLVPRICRATGLAMPSFLVPRGADLRFMAVRIQAWRFALRGREG